MDIIPIAKIDKKTFPRRMRIDIKGREDCDTPDCSGDPVVFVGFPMKGVYGVKCQECHEQGWKEVMGE